MAALLFRSRVEYSITLRGKRLAQTGLLRTRRPISPHAEHQVALFAKLIQFAGFLRFLAICLPPGAGELAPHLTIGIRRFIEFVQIAEEAGDSRNLQYAAHDSGPAFERPQACRMQGFSGSNPGLNKRQCRVDQRRAILLGPFGDERVFESRPQPRHVDPWIYAEPNTAPTHLAGQPRIVAGHQPKCIVPEMQHRSEERRVGKECRSPWSPHDY